MSKNPYKVSKQEAIDRLTKAWDDKISCIEYSGAATKKSKFQCLEGHEWFAPLSDVALPTGVKRSGCPVCGHETRRRKRRVTEGVAKERLKHVWGDQITLTRYSGEADIKSTFECSNGHKWEQVLTNVAPASGKRGTGCAICLSRAPFTEKTADERVRNIWGDRIDLIKFGGNARFKSTFRCALGHEWDAPFYHVAPPPSNTRKPTSCPICAHGRGERELYELLCMEFGAEQITRQFAVNSDKRYRYDFCVSKNGLPYIFIERQGEQHFHAVRWSSSMSEGDAKELWQNVKESDTAKFVIAKELGVPLIYVPYWWDDEDILTELERLNDGCGPTYRDGMLLTDEDFKPSPYPC